MNIFIKNNWRKVSVVVVLVTILSLLFIIFGMGQELNFEKYYRLMKIVEKDREPYYWECLKAQNTIEEQKWVSEGKLDDWRVKNKYGLECPSLYQCKSYINDKKYWSYDWEKGNDYFSGYCSKKADESPEGKIYLKYREKLYGY